MSHSPQVLELIAQPQDRPRRRGIHSVMNAESIAIVDCHVHFLDAELLAYPIFQRRSPGFEALVGDYSALPRRYLPEDYLHDANGLNVVKAIWAEFMSTDPAREVHWADMLSHSGGLPQGIIAPIDFLSPDAEEVLDSYRSLRRVRAVRQHLVWHPTNPLLRYAPRGDILADKAWQDRLALLRRSDLCCEIEIVATQLPDLTAVTRSYPDIRFILPLMGWPIDLTESGRRDWKRDMAALSRCGNVAVKIVGLECIFGLRWTIDQVRPWVLSTIELFGPERCMFASLMPIARLARTFPDLYRGYFTIVSGFSASERRTLFGETATKVYRLPDSDPAREGTSVRKAI
jgi:predicted TIM-barrel fold metal-dependent hydrolase